MIVVEIVINIQKKFIIIKKLWWLYINSRDYIHENFTEGPSQKLEVIFGKHEIKELVYLLLNLLTLWSFFGLYWAKWKLA